jgi:ketosteroid isomerase-like protein
MQEHRNLAIVRQGYECFAAGDASRLHELMADYAIWHEPGRSQLSGDYKGPEEIVDFFRRLHDLSGGTVRVEPIEMLAGPERVMVIHRVTAERDGDQLDTIDAVDFEIHHDRITEVTVFQSDTPRFDEFWA